MRILVVGDVHGQHYVWRFIKTQAKNFDCDVIFVCGDIGWDFPKSSGPEEWKFELPTYWVDGNHENFDSLYAKTNDLLEFQELRPNLFYVPRGTRWEWEGVTFLGFGGGVSVDRQSRLEYEEATKLKVWWPQEMITEEEIQRVDDSKVDVMFCHDTPNSVFWAWFNQTTDTRIFDHKRDPDSELNRQRLDQVFLRADPQVLFHGHWHIFHKHDVKGCTVIGLADSPNDNWWVLDLEEMKK